MENAGETGIAVQSGADSGAVDARNDPLDADLAALIEAWPTLDAAVKASILALVMGHR